MHSVLNMRAKAQEACNGGASGHSADGAGQATDDYE